MLYYWHRIRDFLRKACRASLRVNSNTGWRTLNVGGNWNNAGNAGLFYFNVNNSASNTNSNIGTRLLVFQRDYACEVPHRLVKILPYRTGFSRFFSNNLAGKQGQEEYLCQKE